MRVALTGATGFLGSHIAEALLASGHAVRGIARSPEKGAWLAERGVELARADLGEPEALARGLEGADALIANAAMGSFQGTLEDQLRVNVQGTENLLGAAAAAGVRRVVLISTTAVYRTRLGRWMGEDAERYGLERRWFNWSDATTDWRYALSKSRAEASAWRLAGERGLALTALRPGPIYGPRDPKFTARLLAGLRRPLRLAPTVRVPLVHAADVAAAAAAALERPETAGGAYNLSGPPVSLLEVMRTLRGLRGDPAALIPLPVPIWIGYDTAAAERDLGFHSRPLEEGLASLV